MVLLFFLLRKGLKRSLGKPSLSLNGAGALALAELNCLIKCDGRFILKSLL